jgi:hypothetical protein
MSGVATRRFAMPRPVRADAAGGTVLGALLAILALLTGSGVTLGSGFDLGANTWTEMALVVLGAGAVVAVALWGARGPRHGLIPLLAFAAFAVLTAVSITWSWQPDASWSAANQIVAYLAVFAIGVAGARVLPERWRAPIAAVAIAAVVVSVVALLSKAFLGFPAADETLGRLTSPLGYWNAIGLLAAMGLPACLWLGAGESHPPALRAATVPAIAALAAVIVLSYSRSAVVVAIIALAAWFALVPLRLRAAVILLPGLAGGGAISAWALTHPLLTHNHNHPPLHALAAAGHTFALVLLATLLLTVLAGAAIAWPGARVRLEARDRRRAGAVLLTAAALLPVAGIAALAASSRGLTGEVSHLWSELTSTRGTVGTNPNRLVSVANSRPAYWHTALRIGADHPLAGVGALGYAVARTRYVPLGSQPVQNAHGFLFETFSDLGAIGIAVALALLLAWAVAVSRSLSGVGAETRRAERTGLLTLLAIVLCFGLQSAIDWTWYVPAVAVPALLAAGWLAGRGPPEAPVGRRTRRLGLLERPAIPLLLTAATVIALALCWGIVQPLRSAQSDDDAVAAAARGQAGTAIADARAAVARDPFSTDAMSLLSSLYLGAGEPGSARAELVLETRRQPENYVSWRDLGNIDLARHDVPAALKELTMARAENFADYSVYFDYLAAVRAAQAR